MAIEDFVEIMLSTYRYLAPRQQLAMHHPLAAMGSQTFNLEMARAKIIPNETKNKLQLGILAKGCSLTQSDASQFELVEAKDGRKCGVCSQRGNSHNATNFPQREGQTF